MMPTRFYKEREHTVEGLKVHRGGSSPIFFKQKTAYEIRIRDWSSDVCSSDLLGFLWGSILYIKASIQGL